MSMCVYVYSNYCFMRSKLFIGPNLNNFIESSIEASLLSFFFFKQKQNSCENENKQMALK